MILEHEGKRPNIAASVRIAPNAIVCGDVVIGENCSIGFGAVLMAESGAIAIGRNCVIMDTAVLRGVRRNSLTLGNNILVGPRAYLSGCTIEDDVFLATGSTVFNGARIGRRAEVRVNGIVHIRTVVEEDAMFRSDESPSAIPPASSRRRSTTRSGRRRRRSTFRNTSSAWSGRGKAGP